MPDSPTTLARLCWYFNTPRNIKTCARGLVSLTCTELRTTLPIGVLGVVAVVAETGLAVGAGRDAEPAIGVRGGVDGDNGSGVGVWIWRGLIETSRAMAPSACVERKRIGWLCVGSVGRLWGGTSLYTMVPWGGGRGLQDDIARVAGVRCLGILGTQYTKNEASGEENCESMITHGRFFCYCPECCTPPYLFLRPDWFYG